jgi:hypothetical protein
VHTPHEALEKLPVAPCGFKPDFCSSPEALEKQLNTTTKG